MRTLLATAIIFGSLSIYSIAGELLKPETLLGTKELCISDGSSIYIFSPDKKFRLEPLGLSGRTIEGTWKQDFNGIHITGQWAWINGLSATDDFREMDIHIGSLQDTTRDHNSMLSGTEHKIYECYFLIERVEKIKKANKSEMATPRKPSD